MNSEQLQQAQKLKKEYDEQKATLEYTQGIKAEDDPVYTSSALWTRGLKGLTISQRRVVKTLICALLLESFNKAEKEWIDFHA